MIQDTGTLTAEIASLDAEIAASAAKALSGLVRLDDLVGDLLKIDYAVCDILVHDHLRQKVGGLPLGCFLLATRLNPGSTPSPDQEDTSLILLRVTAQSRLPNASETDMSRFLAGQRAAAAEQTWDAEGNTDQFTLHQLRYSGVQCRVLGTFRMRRVAKEWKVVFGADISNFYSGRGMKIYKPVGPALRQIVNFTKPGTDETHPLAGKRVSVGRVRYASSERTVDAEGENVEVNLDPTDLIARRTALFGMSRTGKSNTTKVIASSVFKIRELDAKHGRVGQLIFDVNGEYANENTQDGGLENPSCLKNVGLHTKNAASDDVVTYGLWPHPNDPNRKIVKINFFGSNPANWQQREPVVEALDTLYVGKTLVDAELSEYGDKYIKSFQTTSLEPPKEWDQSASTRYQRLILAYRAALAAADFRPPNSQKTVRIKGLFGKELRDAMKNSSTTDGNDLSLYQEAAGLLDKETIGWEQAIRAMQGLRRFMADKNSGFQTFNSKYMSDHDGRPWADPSFVNILEIFAYANGVRTLIPVAQSHSPDISGDFAQLVIEDLLAGRLVIFDQSLGDPDQNAKASERIMWAIFNRQKQAFIAPEKSEDGSLKRPPDVLVYAEEAHNLLPANSALDVSNIWSRVAKEGSKYRIGLVYATQEPSSIQSNIMKNTDNWFVAHLNNSDETKELRKYYDFDDFAQSILQVPDPGFLRMRTLSNPYIVPVQVNRFAVKA